MSRAPANTERHCSSSASLSYRWNNGHCLWHRSTQRCSRDKTIKWAGVAPSFMSCLNVVLSRTGRRGGTGEGGGYLWRLEFYWNCWEEIVDTRSQIGRRLYIKCTESGEAWEQSGGTAGLGGWPRGRRCRDKRSRSEISLLNKLI